jgi:hypothetical protein
VRIHICRLGVILAGASAGLAIGAPSALAQSNSVNSTISSNFNGTAIGSNKYIWFSAHVTSLTVPASSTPITIFAHNQTVSFNVGSQHMVVNIPDAEIVVQPGASPSTTFGVAVPSTWVTTVPSGSGNPFISGLGWQAPSTGLPGGINPVDWSIDFSSSVGGVSLAWQWGAAVYSNFSSMMNSVGATPIDGIDGQSGTPSNYKQFVLGGARGGGGSNFTGSNSATKGVANIPVIPAPGGGAVMLAGGGMLWSRRRR